MIRILIVILLTVFSVLLYGCTLSSETELPVPDIITSYDRIISYEEAQHMINDNPHIIILDVRTEQEHLTRNMSGSLLLPVDELNEETAARLFPDMNSVILIYCRTGIRSGNAVEILRNMGYINVYDMDGIENWD